MKKAKYCFLTMILGVVATLVMDIGNFVLFKFNLISQIDEVIIARLIIGWSKLQFIYNAPSMLPIVENAQIKGTVFHYLIGIFFACYYIYLENKWLYKYKNTFVLAAIYGTFTSLVSLCLLFPSLGLGFFGLKTGSMLLVSSLINHFIYGIGIGIGFSIIRKKYGNMEWGQKNGS
jgi:hypothetical protein